MEVERHHRIEHSTAGNPLAPSFKTVMVRPFTSFSPRSRQLTSATRTALRIPSALAAGDRLRTRADALLDRILLFLDTPDSLEKPTQDEIDELVSIRNQLDKNSKLLKELKGSMHKLLAAAKAGDIDAATTISRVHQGTHIVRDGHNGDAEHRAIVFGM